MFTSRAEYRLQLREDNADTRLTEIGYRMGIVDEKRWSAFSRKAEAVKSETERLNKLWATPGNTLGAAVQAQLNVPITRECNVLDLIKRPEITYARLMSVANLGPGVSDEKVAEQIEISVKYSGYLDRQREDIERQRRHEDTEIPVDFNYQTISGLGNELESKLMKVRPQTIGQAQRIPGMTPAAISLLLVTLSKRRRVA
jgi:tRNA uridine 5-carboxymethylaminomethyl modification enzyme